MAMQGLHRGFDGDGFLPDGLGAMLRRRLREIAGVVLMGLCALAAAALATWSVKDPSFSHATGAPTHNLLGAPGAVAADLLMQLFGIACVAVIFPVGAWGWRLLTGRRIDRARLRLIVWVVGALLAAAFVSCFTRTANWPLPTGLGGVIGDMLLRGPAALAGGTLSGLPRLVIAAVLGAFSLASVAVACGVGFRRPAEETDAAEADEPEDDESASVSIGWLVHGFLSPTDFRQHQLSVPATREDRVLRNV